MKNFILLFAVLSTLMLNATQFVKPKSLKPGDNIAIISPASSPDSSFIEVASKVLKEWGYNPIVSENAYARKGSFAGTIKQRLDDMKWAFENKDIKAVLCTRGGFGSIQELCEIESGYFAKHPKWLIGYSDITSIHSSLSSDRVMSIHAHMCEHLKKYNGKDTCSIILRKILAGEKMKYTLKSNELNHCGIAKGILCGGNLSVLNRLAGSRIDYINNTDDDIILFIEDVNESIEKVNGMMYRLKIAGILPRIKGLIVGNFKGYEPTSDFETMEEMINDVMKNYKIPICYKFPIGHTTLNMPLIVGTTVTLNITPENTCLESE